MQRLIYRFLLVNYLLDLLFSADFLVARRWEMFALWIKLSNQPLEATNVWAWGRSLAKTFAWLIICLNEIGCLLSLFSNIHRRSLSSICGYFALGSVTIFLTCGEPAKVLYLENSTIQFLKWGWVVRVN